MLMEGEDARFAARECLEGAEEVSTHHFMNWVKQYHSCSSKVQFSPFYLFELVKVEK